MKKKPAFWHRPEQFSFVNPFGPRFLKNRIRMMNQTARYRRSWPVYVFLLALVSLVTTMAAVVKQKRKTGAPVAAKPVEKPVITRSAIPKKAMPGKDPKTVEKPVITLIERPATVPDSVRNLAGVTVTDIEKQSRYAVRKGDRIYWVITPKMSFKELAELKQIIENDTRYTFDFTEIKFDPFQLYIDAIKVNVHKEKGGSGSTDEGDESDEPIKSIGGYLSRTERGELGIGGVSGADNLGTPSALKQVAEEDEKAVAGLIAQNRMRYFILKNELSGPGSSRQIIGQWLRDNPGRRNEELGVFINTENRLQLYQPENVTLLINGREMNTSEVTQVDSKELHTVIVKDIQDGPSGSGRKKRYVQLFMNQP
ncbi:hypothetical protein LX87_02790 [Larkinella arboricola]|uniref:Uncharacterized protein n=1 Tax=Larkinella arboricola TaxID=643671 RepID=A0A327X0S3_LARAB|nr:hypothetical protein [Larkinella arboricola]RAJ97884.1 hypothetical protein LX87_02790 [Larkinella arboricola]